MFEAQLSARIVSVLMDAWLIAHEVDSPKTLMCTPLSDAAMAGVASPKMIESKASASRLLEKRIRVELERNLDDCFASVLGWYQSNDKNVTKCKSEWLTSNIRELLMGCCNEPKPTMEVWIKNSY